MESTRATEDTSADSAVTEGEMTRADIAELEDRVSRLEATVTENSRRIALHARIGWTLFILWLIGQTAAVIVILRFLYS